MNRGRMFALVLAAVVWVAPAGRGADEETPTPVKVRYDLPEANTHRDFPDLAVDGQGVPWMVFIEHDAQADVLKLARRAASGLEVVATVAEPGIVHQPALAFAGDGALWCFWGQIDERDVVTLRARRFADGAFGKEITLAKSAGGDTFADAGTDAAGRVWVVWQSMRRGQGDIFARWLDPKSRQWSAEIAVSKPAGGNWEPRVAFAGRDGAWVVFDSSRDGDFNLYLARVGLDGQVAEEHLTRSPTYEARASIATGKDGMGFWIAAERGIVDWGKPVRGHDGPGLNGQKRILLGWYDVASGEFSEVAVPQRGRFTPGTPALVNLPVVTTDASGDPWLAWRYCVHNHWRIAVARYDVAAKTWSQPRELPDSSFCQDRRAVWARAGEAMWLGWPSDRRTSNKAAQAAVFLVQLNDAWPPGPPPAGKMPPTPDPDPFLHPPSPPRSRDQHHAWQIGGKTYRLVFGDLHRHTDFSNCRVRQDGCVLEQFRYACDVAALDFLGTSDHTDVGKPYDPYEWWQTQRLADVFYVPGRFHSLYGYEREQRFPWGHRNVIFAQRGGPIVHISRQLYQESPWHARYPVEAAGGEITPMELWRVLRQYGQPVAVISHTGATPHGTDWEQYDHIDEHVENTVEIFQGARVSYEGRGAPQPAVGLRRGQPYGTAGTQLAFPEPPAAIDDFGRRFNQGTYQHALKTGHKLGVFASSDHISTHAAFGGVYVEENTRRGIVAGLQARRSIAATAKIFIEFSCNDRPMGAVFAARGQPELKFAVHGTGALRCLTLVRNETNYQTWEPGDREFAATFTDPDPLAGENRYYLRVEQADGNLAWSSPVWVTITK